jgi:hypothetical protein
MVEPEEQAVLEQVAAQVRVVPVALQVVAQLIPLVQMVIMEVVAPVVRVVQVQVRQVVPVGWVLTTRAQL